MTKPTREQLHHLADRARRGVALDAEHDQLAAGITAMADARDAARNRLDFHDRITMPDLRRRIEADAETVKRWRTRAEQAEAAIERVRKLATRLEEFAENALKTADRQLYAALASDLRAAIDQAQQPTTTEAAPFGDRHGPTPGEVRAGIAGLFTAIGPPVACPHCGPDAAPIPSTHWTKHLIRHHPEQPTA